MRKFIEPACLILAVQLAFVAMIFGMSGDYKTACFMFALATGCGLFAYAAKP